MASDYDPDKLLKEITEGIKKDQLAEHWAAGNTASLLAILSEPVLNNSEYVVYRTLPRFEILLVLAVSGAYGALKRAQDDDNHQGQSAAYALLTLLLSPDSALDMNDPEIRGFATVLDAVKPGFGTALVERASRPCSVIEKLFGRDFNLTSEMIVNLRNSV